MNKLEMNMVVIQEVFRNEEYVANILPMWITMWVKPSILQTVSGRMDLSQRPIEAI